MIVSDVEIDDEFITVKGSMTIIEISKEMARVGIPDAVVVDDDDKVLGAVDDYDIVSKCLAEEKDPMVLTAEEIMFSPPPIRIDTDLKAVHEMMQELEATMLPVTDTEKNLKGVVTLMDVLDGLGRERQSMSLLQRIFS